MISTSKLACQALVHWSKYTTFERPFHVMHRLRPPHVKTLKYDDAFNKVPCHGATQKMRNSNIGGTYPFCLRT